MRILFTGGTGKAGRHVVPYLMAKGHRVLNVDLKPLDHPGVLNRIADITDAGQMFDVMTNYADFDELEPGTGMPSFDAVVHFAAVPRIMITSDNECYRVNTLGTYNVIDAALRAGVRKVIVASSENEVTARSFQRRSGADIYALRINNVIEPHEYKSMFPDFITRPEKRRRNIFAYIDVRDLGEMVECCLRTDGLGYEVFNVSNDDHSVAASTSELIAQFYDGVPVKKDMGETETFYSNDKAKRMLDYKPAHNWRMYLDDPTRA